MAFDAITAGVVGVQGYMAMEPVKPVELLGLWTLGDGVYADHSRYSGYSQIPGTTEPTTAYGFPVLKCPISTTLNFTLGKSLNLQQDWSFEYMRWEPAGRPYSYADLGVLCFFNDAYDDSYSRIKVNNSQITYFDGWRTPNSSTHNAVTYESSTHTIRCYKNGSLVHSYVYDTTGLSPATMISLVNASVGYSGSDTNYGRSNLRVVQKRLGDMTYPTPTDLYTGFEQL